MNLSPRVFEGRTHPGSQHPPPLQHAQPTGQHLIHPEATSAVYRMKTGKKCLPSITAESISTGTTQLSSHQQPTNQFGLIDCVIRLDGVSDVRSKRLIGVFRSHEDIRRSELRLVTGSGDNMDASYEEDRGEPEQHRGTRWQETLTIVGACVERQGGEKNVLNTLKGHPYIGRISEGELKWIAVTACQEIGRRI